MKALYLLPIYSNSRALVNLLPNYLTILHLLSLYTMFILAGKLLLWMLCFIFIHSNYPTTSLAQPDFVYYFCENAANYTVNSKYQSNLNNALPALPTTNRGLGFYKLSLGNGNDTVNTVALCRGDVNSDVCDSCVNDSIVKLPQLCPNQKAAIGYYDYCFLTYSNEIILNNPRISFVYLSNHQNATDSERFNSALAPLLRQLRGYAAAAAPLAKFASGNVTGPGFTTIYVIMQCIPDLSEQQCMDCLEDIINRMAQYYNGKVGGRVLLPMCNFRYETYKFFNGSTAQVVSPPSSPPILQSSPSVPQQTPPPGMYYIFFICNILKKQIGLI
ncbi:putative Gnk2-like domain-containing protein [Helianthus annuus]|uniref:Gnk2-like domain-containing protein n=1 Tax=Helianthus annuus TaxID=4232 RepID=A0A251RS84_HELAN|nr:putative Gnk2-like domain-containing protein [Helianthus annuus]KAJ0429986.1 putative Gnk2-like domain-containing protein [Helianthus annuus]KAJ0448422.1 putative Gnk2-like domain-containing protein [Helianthus annuus]KAJ0633310.1 putative Gnk2-like domain-containing protein [Helianthus annuus]KAJ0798347.1 putative Gnk2-like domain-containing protein [Helianthus annuus]